MYLSFHRVTFSFLASLPGEDTSMHSRCGTDHTPSTK
jgi:hypothetical protein